MFGCLRCNCVSLVVLVVLAVMPSLILAKAPNKASLLANTCTVCHGSDGQGSQKIPAIKGEAAIDLSESMIGFRSGTERSTIMGRIVKSLTDEEIQLVANYFSRL